MTKLCPICGPKMSAFCMIISSWGVIFLGILGAFFYIQSVTLFPDLELTNEALEHDNYKDVIEGKYSERARQCWVAAGLYLLTLIIVFWQNQYNTNRLF